MIEKLFSGNILVVAPHFDDEILGCGGTLLKARQYMSNLSVVHLAVASNSRSEEFNAVAASLSLSNHRCLSLEDGYLSEYYAVGVRSLVEVIQSLLPKVILIPHEHEDHPDHKAARQIAFDAAQKARFWTPNPAGCHHRVESILEYEVWTPMVNPSIIINISNVFHAKCEMMKCYKSQLSYFPYIEYINAFNTWRGILHNKQGQAEVFHIISL
ncbi:MAG: PIG-L deacetylase family protein [Cuspidothrix sp.]